MPSNTADRFMRKLGGPRRGRRKAPRSQDAGKLDRPHCPRRSRGKEEPYESLPLKQESLSMKYDGTLTADSDLPVLKPNGEIDFGVGEDETPFGEGADHELFSRIRSSRRGFSEETLLPYRHASRLLGKMLRRGPRPARSRWRGRSQVRQPAWPNIPDAGPCDRDRRQQADVRVLTAGESRARRTGLPPSPTFAVRAPLQKAISWLALLGREQKEANGGVRPRTRQRPALLQTTGWQRL